MQRFEHLEKTQFPPKDKPVLIWDGQCGFCAYWVTRWELITQGKIDFMPFQEAITVFTDIDERYFKTASRLVDTDGKIYSGPAGAYKSLEMVGKYKWLNRMYESQAWFAALNDLLYHIMANRRNAAFRLTKFLLGSNPKEFRPFWAIYLCVLLYIVYSLL